MFALRLLIAVVVGLLLIPTQGMTKERPNVILMMADDLGVECLECYGGTSYQTPALDRLAEQGIRFTQAYAQPLCTNTRVQLMTGLYNNRNWIAFGLLDPEATTLGHLMKRAGYDTCIVGKWQLQSYDPPDFPGAELRRGKGMKVNEAGFDEYSLFHSWHTEDKGSRYANPTIYQNGKLLQEIEGEYGPDLWVEYIEDYLERKQDSERLFFLYYPMALPHWPMVPTPNSPEWKDPSRRHEEDTKYFKDMVEYMDDCVGRIVNKVDALGLKEETLILFYSDNGTHLKITSQTKDGPVAGGKGMTTDAGTHVPLIARWPGMIEPGVNDNLIDSTDFLPTVLAAAGESVPEELQVDGVSFYPQLLGKPGTPREWIFCHFEPRPGWDKDQFTKLRFARDQRFKLYGDGRLYDLPNDKLEQHPIPKPQTAKAANQARAKLQAVLDRMPNRASLKNDGTIRSAKEGSQ